MLLKKFFISLSLQDSIFCKITIGWFYVAYFRGEKDAEYKLSSK